MNTSMNSSRALIYAALKGEPTQLELVADICSVLTTVGHYIRQKYGEQDFLELLDFVDTTNMSKDRNNHRLTSTHND